MTMSESTLEKKLQRISDELQVSGKTDKIVINALKQELQYAILDFVYNHPEYSRLVMYGGTLLRIVYNLPRMSEDLDFQTSENVNLEHLKQELTTHFTRTYNMEIEVTIKTRLSQDTQFLIIAFPILESFHLPNIRWKSIKIRFDVNSFPQMKKFATEIVPVVHEDMAFSILTYPLSTLMASKITAVFQRTARGVGHGIADCKPRDIYDLLWYLEKRVVPDLRYIQARGESYETVNDLFYGNEQKKGLQFRVMNLSDSLFKVDLAQFFFDETDLDAWLENGKWKNRFTRLMAAYAVHKISQLDSISFGVDFSSSTRTIRYRFNTTENSIFVEFVVKLSKGWFVHNDIRIESGHKKKEIEAVVESAKELNALDREYVGLFFEKINAFLSRNKQVVLGDQLTTKLIRTTADKLIPSQQVYVDKKMLETLSFGDLLV